ncbi:MAG: SDR family NAD(P)-dependent oxidoreductase [Candidatus Dadabacteria bacterium]|nr:MAG: SDR family NAD(P)-dependent oxidoreductase [Candidatus Dadabacteria bacterium]
MRWTAADIPDLSGKIAIVTGANRGLGRATVRALAAHGATVVMGCRDPRLGDAAAHEIRDAHAAADLRVWPLNLQSLASIRAFAMRAGEHLSRVDILINNAGVMNTPYGLTEDGFEAQMGTNHLGHFALTGGLLPLLRRAPQARVVTVSSLAHKMGKLDRRAPMFPDGRGYTPFRAYARSKLANLLFMRGLQRRFAAHGWSAVAIGAHPGAAQTDLGRHIEGHLFFRVFEPVLRKLVQDAEAGALPQLRAATDPAARGGSYYGPDGRGEMAGYPVLVKPSRRACSDADADWLWEWSERVTGVRFDFSA